MSYEKFFLFIAVMGARLLPTGADIYGVTFDFFNRKHCFSVSAPTDTLSNELVKAGFWNSSAEIQPAQDQEHCFDECQNFDRKTLTCKDGYGREESWCKVPFYSNGFTLQYFSNDQSDALKLIVDFMGKHVDCDEVPFTPDAFLVVSIPIVLFALALYCLCIKQAQIHKQDSNKQAVDENSLLFEPAGPNS